MARIPIAGDLVSVIGPFAEGVENRSLLLDKFVFHKSWPPEIDDRGRPIKWDEATRWSFVRIADGASQILSREANEKRRRARSNMVSEENRTRYLGAAQIAESLSRVAWDTKDLSLLRAKHTRRFISLFRSAFGSRAAIAIGQLEGRLAINLADSLIQNAGICLDRLFGLPFIPGSAVKGVCRHTALEELKAGKGEDRARLFELFLGVFGTADNDFANGDLQPFRELLGSRPENQRGLVCFLPAYPVNEAKVVVDLTNVHYPDYYQTGRPEDLSKERPLPNPFPAVEIGAQFAFCLMLNRPSADAKILEAARRWLESALVVRGLGAKTASGYGWFSLQPHVLDEIVAEERRAKELAEELNKKAAEAKAKEAAEAARLAAMPPSQVARERFSKLSEEAFAKAVSEMASLSVDEQKGLLLALLAPEKKDAWKRWKKSDKPANKGRVEALLAAAKTHGVSLP
jgi:CRISPR-associated protein Cmr6